MNIKLAVFDMAGTTVDDGDAVNDCLRAALANAGLVVQPSAVNAVMGLHKPEAIRLLVDASPQAAQLRDRQHAIHQDFVARMRQFYQTSPRVREVDGASETFAALHRAGIKVALNTGFSRDIVNVILERLHWNTSAVLDATITSDEVARGRPHPD